MTVQSGFVSDLVGNPEDRFSHNEAHSSLGIDAKSNHSLPFQLGPVFVWLMQLNANINILLKVTYVVTLYQHLKIRPLP